MKKYFSILSLVPTLAMAQEMDPITLDSLTEKDNVEVAPQKHTLGLYGFLGIDIAPSLGGTNGLGTSGVGIKYNRVEVGFIYSTFIDTIQRRLVFPNFFNLIYRHGGVYVSYSIIASEWADFALLGVFQLGDMVWEHSDTSDGFLRETFNQWQVGISVETPILTYVRPGVTIGYQRLSDIQLPGISNQDFSGAFIGIKFKIGYFNQ